MSCRTTSFFPWSPSPGQAFGRSAGRRPAPRVTGFSFPRSAPGGKYPANFFRDPLRRPSHRFARWSGGKAAECAFRGVPAVPSARRTGAAIGGFSPAGRSAGVRRKWTLPVSDGTTHRGEMGDRRSQRRASRMTRPCLCAPRQGPAIGFRVFIVPDHRSSRQSRNACSESPANVRFR